MIDAWLRAALDTSGISQSELSRQLTAKLGRSIDRAAVNKMTKKTREVAADEMLAIAEITGVSPPVPAADAMGLNTVPLVGYVGAGAEAHIFGEGQGPFDEVEAPDGATPDTVAVEIRGESLGSLFDQWLVFYDDVHEPPRPELLRKLCVVGLADGRVLVKRLERGQLPNHFNLISNTEPPIYDAIVEWAARVKQMTPR